MSGAPLLEVQDLVKHFPIYRGLLRRRVGEVRAVNGVSFKLDAGETLAVVGESGCGKSTTGRALLRLIEPTSGAVRLGGEDVLAMSRHRLRAFRRRMQIIFQDPFGSLNPRMTVRETIFEPLLLHKLATKAEAEARMLELLGLCGLSSFHAERYPHEFSGGQRQRVGVARALATRPELIVCDEPVSALDVSVQAQIVNLLQDLQRRFGVAYIFIGHDLAVVRHIAQRVAVMYLGRIVEEAPAAALFARPRHPYTQALIAAAPRPEPDCPRAPIPVEGDAPSAAHLPDGCAFHPRCPLAEGRCRTERPALRRLGESLVACHLAERTPPPRPRPVGPSAEGAFGRRLATLAAARRARDHERIRS